MPENENEKFIFLDICNVFRDKHPYGEDLWEEMMYLKEKLPEELIFNKVNLAPLLDEEENPFEFIQYEKDCDPANFGFFKSTMDGKDVYFLASSGFEYIFTDKDSTLFDYKQEITSSLDNIKDYAPIVPIKI